MKVKDDPSPETLNLMLDARELNNAEGPTSGNINTGAQCEGAKHY